MLYVFVKESDAKDEMFTRLHKSVTRGGTLVLNSDERAGECSGTVIHYNPDRAGVIAIDSGAEDSKDIVLLFGPDLKRAGILSLKREERLLFRVRNEGGVAFAVDIRRDESI